MTKLPLKIARLTQLLAVPPPKLVQLLTLSPTLLHLDSLEDRTFMLSAALGVPRDVAVKMFQRCPRLLLRSTMATARRVNALASNLALKPEAAQKLAAQAPQLLLVSPEHQGRRLVGLQLALGLQREETQQWVARCPALLFSGLRTLVAKAQQLALLFGFPKPEARVLPAFFPATALTSVSSGATVDINSTSAAAPSATWDEGWEDEAALHDDYNNGTVDDGSRPEGLADLCCLTLPRRLLRALGASPQLLTRDPQALSQQMASLQVNFMTHRC